MTLMIHSSVVLQKTRNLIWFMATITTIEVTRVIYSQKQLGSEYMDINKTGKQLFLMFPYILQFSNLN